MIKQINNWWNWLWFNAIEVTGTNEFGNIIFKTDKNEYWRLIPEEWKCTKIVNSQSDIETLITTNDFKNDWEMKNLVNIAKAKYGELTDKEKYCLKIPTVVGWKYEESNIGKISFSELIEFSWNMAYKIKDLKDWENIEFKIVN